MAQFSFKIEFVKGTTEEYRDLRLNLADEGFKQINDLHNEATCWYQDANPDSDMDINRMSAAIERAVLKTAASFSRKFTKDYYLINTPSVGLKFLLKDLLATPVALPTHAQLIADFKNDARTGVKFR